MNLPRIQPDWLTQPETQAVFKALCDAGFEARTVGGSVRNALIGKPASDIDLATTALPEQVMAAATAAGLAVVPTGLQHGTVTVMAGGEPFEVTTLRRDVETDGRHAVVAFTDDWAVDASRRDFTINALYCDADGQVHDPLGGYGDLVARRVRFIGDADARIREDHLRILRFFRFTAEYAGGAPDMIGLSACGRLRDGLQQLSAERIRVEILKMLAAPRAAEMATVMVVHGFWPSLLGLVVRPQHLARMARLEAATAHPPDPLLRLAALAIETPEDAARLAVRLRLSGGDRTRLNAVARLAGSLSVRLSADDLRLLLYREGRDRVMAALRVAAARDAEDMTAIHAAAATLPVPVLPVRGQDLMDAGCAPGPGIGAELRRLEAMWIESGFSLTKAALLERVR